MPEIAQPVTVTLPGNQTVTVSPARERPVAQPVTVSIPMAQTVTVSPARE